MSPDEREELYAEIVRLRDWRHDHAMPELVAARERVKQLAEHLTRVDGRLDVLEAKIERMAKADEIAAAVTEHARHSRRGILTAWQAIILGLGAVGGSVSAFLQLFRH